MAGIRGRDTKPELLVRRLLHARGLRFRVHAPYLLGRPDLVFRRHKVLVFVHGCFWHQHKHCRFAYMPATNRAFWRKKLKGNVVRDKRTEERLAKEGWRVLVIWECALRANEAHLSRNGDAAARWINGAGKRREIPSAEMMRRRALEPRNG